MRKWLWLLVLVFVVIPVAGCKPGAEASAACAPPPEIAHSEELAQSLDRRLLPYLQGQTGRFDLRTTSQELTSWIAYSTAKWSGIPVRHAVVWFSPDRVHFAGVITRVLIFSFRVQVHARVWLQAETLQVSVEQACVGQTALPGWAKNLAGRIITETILDTGPYVRLDSLEIGDGYLRASGHIGR